MLSGRNENGINYYTARKLKDMSQSLEQLAKAFDDGAGETGSLTKDDLAGCHADLRNTGLRQLRRVQSL